MGYAEELGERLRAIETSAREIDAGGAAAAVGAAEAILTIFHQSHEASSLLSHLNASYVKLASSVPKPPHPHDKFSPLTDVRIDLGGALSASTHQMSAF